MYIYVTFKLYTPTHKSKYACIELRNVHRNAIKIFESDNASKRITTPGIGHSNLNSVTDTLVPTRYAFNIFNC